MKKILIDTMHIYALLTSKDNSYVKLSQALDDERITGVISVTTLAELLIFLGGVEECGGPEIIEYFQVPF